ncbi:MAG: hypothetical protein ACK42D_01485 [Candidatus Paceibacteria bacterium]
MITPRAKKVAIVAGVYCFCASVVLVGSVYFTELNKNKFADVRNRNAELRATQQLATTIEQTLRLSEDDRQELDSFFISERDTIHFITNVEALAETLRVSVETTQLAVTPKKDDEPIRLEIGFLIEGSYSNVERMLSALETLPYHKSIPNVSIKSTEKGTWTGAIVLYVTLQ